MVEKQAPSGEPQPEPDLTGRRLGDYQLVRRLARGGMADVYLAEQQSLRRQVAFKVLRSNLASDETYVRRFHNEAQAAASLVHASIVQIYEVGCIDGIHFIAQEYVPGQNLKQLLARRGPLKRNLAVNIMRQVAAALVRAGSRGIVHRDIKPENIMLAPGMEVKVADFGLARVAGENGHLNLTQVGVTLGTPLYMSPEQIEGRPLDPRSDLYSFGVTCYEMLTGNPPFTGDTALSVALQHLKNEPPRLEDLRPDLPGGLCRIVHKMLAKKPAHRYQNAVELLRDLKALRIEGLQEDWPAEMEDMAPSELETVASSRSAATQQLASVMQSEALLSRRRLRYWWWPATILLAFLIGAGAAWQGHSRLLEDLQGDDTLKTARKESAKAQFWHAVNLGTEAAFAAVLEYFKPEESQETEYYINKAKLQLAFLYEENGRLDDAVAILRELSAQESDLGLQASALIELANIHTRRGETFEARNRLLQLDRLFGETSRLSSRERQEWIELLPPDLRRRFEQLQKEREQSGNSPPRPPSASSGRPGS